MASSSSTPNQPKQLVKFLPFKSTADPSFWLSHNSHKLNVLRLSEDGVVLRGYFTPTSNSSGGRRRDGSSGVGTVCGMRYDSSSSITTPTTDTSNDNEDTSHDDDEIVRRNEVIKSTGNIHSLNTLESFKVLNKNTFLNEKCLPTLLKCCGILPSSTDENEDEIMNPNISLLSTVCITYCNLKTNSIVYWFGYPALVPKSGCGIAYSNSTSSTSKCQEMIVNAWGTKVCTRLANTFHQFRVEHEEACMKNNTSEVVWCPPFFMVLKSNNNIKCLSLNKTTYDNLTKEEQDSIIFAFVDPNSTSTNSDNEPEAVGWTLRNLIAYLSLKFGLGGCNRTFLSYRCSVLRRITLPSDEEKEKVDSSSEEEEVLVKMQESFENVGLEEEEEEENDASGVGGSLLLDIAIPLATDYQWPTKASDTTNLSSVYRCVGWENNKNNKPGPRSIDLRPLVSPAHLARQANDLNLRLMKWRALPSLDVDKLSQMKVLLLGAGTLGCGVARTLLGWGVRKITFVDSGRVSYSNPVRQSLFGVEDCIDGGKYKAVAAAESLVTVAGPDVKSEGVVLTIPMPGHAFGSNRSKDGGLAETEAVRKDVEKLHSLIDENDVVFLLTDTRESRWLPTVMALATETPMINAALGLDSWLVMRHGPPSSCLSSISDDNNCQQRLGCYFCSDVVAPENSTRDRTLDQQCTVTRPGLAPIAASMATEIMVAMFHHPLGHCAPAPEQRRNNSGAYAPVDDGKDASSSALGKLPHQIRGTVVTYTMMTPTIPAFPSCTACSNYVVKEYQKERFEFVKAVCCDEDGSYLEKVSGLAKFREDAAKKMEEFLDWDEEEDDM